MHWVKKPSIIIIALTLLGAFLRLNQFPNSPPSLYVDEADVGYQAYSLITTGRDYFGNFLPVHLQSFADFRTPLYIFTAIPGVLAFGLNNFTVRFPAALFGILTIPLIFWCTRNLTRSETLGIFSALILAILPWHIHYSRIAFEVTLLLFLLTAGIGFFAKWIHTNKIHHFLPAILLLLLTVYTYSTAKLFTPLILVILLFTTKNVLAKLNRTQIALAGVFSALLAYPAVKDIFLGAGQNRFSILSVFSDTNSIGPFAHLQWLVSHSATYFPFLFIHPQILAKFFLGNFTNTFYQIINNYFSVFSPEFLIFAGDPNMRHTITGSGVAGLGITILFAVGFIKLVTSQGTSYKIFLLLLLFLSPLPAAITKDGQFHATRLFLFIFPFTLIAAFGVQDLLYKIKALLAKNNTASKKLIILAGFALISLITWEMLRDQFLRLTVYPQVAYKSWDFGWNENVNKSFNMSPKYDEVLIDSLNGTPVQTFYAFYQKIDPTEFQSFTKQPDFKIESLNLSVKKYFNGNISFSEIEPSWLDKPLPKKVLAVVPAIKMSEKEFRNVETVDIVKNPWGDPLYFFITNKLHP